MRVLIPTQSHDIHAKVVARALHRLGHEGVLWYGSDLPSRQTITLEIEATGEPRFFLRGAALDSSAPFDTVWLRRPVAAVLPSSMHPADQEFAHREWNRWSRAIWHSVGPNALWVNPWHSAMRARAKPNQLSEAAAAGFTIPRTLVSNDPDRIRAFIRDCPAQTIYKPFCTSQWRHEQGTAFLFTAVVTEDDLPDDEVLRQAPGIFQPRIPKSHELRVTIIGNHIFAFELDSQALDVAQVDWRAGTRSIGIRALTLPPGVQERCRALMKRLGLVFGCLDFIVNPQGDYVFVEVNEAGQFLWLEELVPEQHLLDAFCTLLISGRPEFAWSNERATLRFSELHDPEQEIQIDALHQPHAERSVIEDQSPASPGAAA